MTTPTHDRHNRRKRGQRVRVRWSMADALTVQRVLAGIPADLRAPELARAIFRLDEAIAEEQARLAPQPPG